ncbi:hypothetical protein BH23CHL5_BH23CHL5_08540 [soil metagenome]
MNQPGQSRHQRTTVLQRSAPRAIEWTAEEIEQGGVVAIPTDTVYGLAASLSHPEAIDRIFALKGRSVAKPIPILLASIDFLHIVSQNRDLKIMALLDEFWPGPLTLAIPSETALPSGVTGADGYVAIRVPNHPIAIEVIGKAGGAVACTSANPSGQPPARSAEEVATYFGETVDVILDGGQTPGGAASTVAALRGGNLEILREGPLSRSRLVSAWDN